MKRCCVVIITHKEKLEGADEKSFIQALKVFNGKKDIKVVLPDNISYDYFEKFKNIYNFEIIKVDNQWLKTYEAYNKMCVTKEFYELFSDYEYTLTYETDAWVYEDRLDEFIDMGYDYYGAPWPQYGYKVGNGGLSLRKTSKMIEIIEKYGKGYNGKPNEDGWFCILHKSAINTCDWKVGINFSLETPSYKLFQALNGLPMGLHGKHLIELWDESGEKLKDYIKKNFQMKKISVVTVNLNNKDGLEKTIRSVVEQTCFSDIEYIVIDGGSTDGSVDVIKQYNYKISHWVSEKDNGVYNAMNKGVDLCNGEYVLFLDSGDYLSSNNVIEEVYDKLDGDIVYGNLYVVTSRGVYLKKYPKRIKDIYFKNETLPHPGSFIRTECLKKYRYSEKYSIISDWIFFYEGIVKYGLTYKHIETPISVFKLGGLSSNVANVKAEKEKYYNSLKYDCKIGVVIPCYNSEKYIEKTIDSLKKQTFVDWKCVIVNDGSTDNSEEIILKCIDSDKRFSYIKQENQGVPPRNVGIRSLDSKYIFCLDSDDIIDENYFSMGAEFLDSNPDYSVFYGNAKFLYDDGTTKDWNLPEYSYTRLLRGNIIYCSFLYRRSDYERTDGYDETMKGFEDWDFLIRLLKNAGKVYRSKSVLFYYRRHEGSMDKTYNRGDNRIKMIDYIFNKNKGIYEENKIKEERLLEPYINKNPKEIITNKMKKLALIIPTKDNSESLLRLLYSIVYHTEYNKTNLALYIVDNGSKESEKNKVIEHINRVIKEYGYNIKFYETDNYTLPQLYNFVVNEKVDADTDLLLFCTDNVELTNDCISNLVNNWSEQCGTLGARLMLEDNTIQHIGYNIKKDNFTCYDVVQKQVLPAEYRNTKINVYGNSNSFMLTSFALWKQLNGFDEKYKSNFFDIDYSIKALLNGKNSYNITGAVCWYHKAIKSKYVKRDENRISKRIKEYLTIINETAEKRREDKAKNA